MNDSSDTTPRAAALFHRLMMAKPPQERVRMGAAMFEAARAIALASVRQQHPGLSAGEERVQLFLRLYERDLAPERIRRTIEQIRAAAARSAG